MGRVCRNLGAHDRAGPLADEALRLRRETLGEADGRVVESLTDPGLVAQYEGDSTTRSGPTARRSSCAVAWPGPGRAAGHRA